MQITGNETTKWFHSFRVYDPSSREPLSDRLIHTVLTEFQFDFVATLEEGIPEITDEIEWSAAHEENRELTDDDREKSFFEKTREYFQDRGVVHSMVPFMWHYRDVRDLLRNIQSVLCAEELFWARNREIEKIEPLSLVKKNESDVHAPFSADLARLAESTELILTTAIDWVGLIMMSPSKTTIDECRSRCRMLGFDTDWYCEREPADK